MKSVGIALLGYGTVGSALERLLLEQEKEIEKRIMHHGLEPVKLELLWVYHRENKPPSIASHASLTASYEEILGDDRVQIVVELMGGKEPATTMIKQAMDHGKHVVTANKLALYEAKGELEEKAKALGLGFLYEASVAAAIPILAVIRESLIYDEVLRIEGILNGSTNFVLTKLSQGMTYEKSLELATELGYLEADPTLDLEGYDAMYKLGILCYTSFGEYPEEIHREGLENLWVPQGKNKLKLMARADKEKRRIHLEEVAPESPFYKVDDGQNALLIETKYGGQFFFQGPGAGGAETATAVLADTMRLAQKIKKT